MITAFLISQDYASFVSSNAIAVNYDSYGVQGHMAEQIQLRSTPETWLIFSCRTWLKLTGDRGGPVICAVGLCAVSFCFGSRR